MLSVSEYLPEMAIQREDNATQPSSSKGNISLTGTLNHLAANLNKIAKRRNGFEELNLEERINLKNRFQEVKAFAGKIKSYLR